MRSVSDAVPLHVSHSSIQINFYWARI